MDHLVATMPQPQVALLDGITMGGGAGISINGTFRVATEKCAAHTSCKHSMAILNPMPALIPETALTALVKCTGCTIG